MGKVCNTGNGNPKVITTAYCTKCKGKTNQLCGVKKCVLEDKLVIVIRQCGKCKMFNIGIYTDNEWQDVLKKFYKP